MQMMQKLAYADDHFHDECGVFGVFGHEEASKLTYLGLYALQHRGQESAGFVSSDGTELHLHRAMGEVEEIFTPPVLTNLPGNLAIGHTRYSTAGDKALLNAQPIMIDCNKGKVALGHNGNLTNAADWRRKLEHKGSIFQTNSDTEVIVHLLARSQARNLSGALGDALNQVEGAYSLLVLTTDELIAVRDPRGFRPLSLGKLGNAWLVASETCAFDISRGQTASSSAARSPPAAKRWAARWRKSIRSARTLSCRCPTPACPQRSVSRWSPAFLSVWA